MAWLLKFHERSTLHTLYNSTRSIHIDKKASWMKLMVRRLTAGDNDANSSKCLMSLMVRRLTAGDHDAHSSKYLMNLMVR